MLINKLQKYKIKKRRVIDCSKILKILGESQEQAFFKTVLNDNHFIKRDHDCSDIINKKGMLTKFNYLDWKMECGVLKESDFDILKKNSNSKSGK